MKLPVHLMPLGLQSANVSNLVNGLWHRGHEIVVYTLDPAAEEEIEFRGDRITVCYGTYRKRFRIFDLFKHERNALVHMMQHRPVDVLHAHWSYEFALAALRVDPDSIITLHDWAPAILRLMPDYYRLGRLIMHNFAIRKARHFLTNSEYMSRNMTRLSNRMIDIIPNPLQPPAGPHAKISGRIVAVNNGFNQLKNVQSLLIAFCEHLKETPTSSLYLIGHGYEAGGPAEGWCKESGLPTHRVTFKGHLGYSETLDEIGVAELLVHPSKEESFGNVLAEAMLRRTAVIGGKASGAVPEVLGYGQAGKLVDITNPQEIADSIRNLLADPEELENLQDRGETFAMATYHPDVIARQHEIIYKQIIDLKNVSKT